MQGSNLGPLICWAQQLKPHWMYQFLLDHGSKTPWAQPPFREWLSTVDNHYCFGISPPSQTSQGGFWVGQCYTYEYLKTKARTYTYMGVGEIRGRFLKIIIHESRPARRGRNAGGNKHPPELNRIEYGNSNLKNLVCNVVWQINKLSGHSRN